jgi:hypothetical protein
MNLLEEERRQRQILKREFGMEKWGPLYFLKPWIGIQSKPSALNQKDLLGIFCRPNPNTKDYRTMTKKLTVFIPALLLFITACSSNKSMEDSAPTRNGGRLESSNTFETRLIQQSAALDIEVDSPELGLQKAREIIKNSGGYVDSTYSYSEKHIKVVARVPQKDLEASIEQLSQLGHLSSRRISSNDVTDEVIDTEARLNNLIALRERFRQILLKAEKIDDILKVESELARIQSEIDSIESRRKSLLGDVHESQIDIQLNQKRILGPLGYIGKGVIWIVSKLFIIK